MLFHKKEIISLLISETGKTKENADYDFTMLTDCLSFYIEEVKRHYAEIIPDPNGRWFDYLSYEPVGVVGAFLAWNFPLLNLGYKLGPVLATGNTAVIKPSTQTPLATAFVGELFSQCGFPSGTINIILGGGEPLYRALAESTVPRLLTMIGSTQGGMAMIKNSLTNIKRYSVELGGNAPVIVFEDADLTLAAKSIAELKFSNAGQICVAPNRVFVHASRYEGFIAQTKDIAQTYKPLGEGAPEIQPVNSEKALTRILASVSSSITHGAKIVCGGKRIPRKGYFIEPTIIRDASAQMSICEEEIFGPVMPIVSFTDNNTIFDAANNNNAGLSAYVFTENLSRALSAVRELQFGNIIVNGIRYAIELPHGGLKQSGYGKDASRHALGEYYDIKRISIRK
ncbi:MAG TPA: NAD-dependent succinate-semialdehyde dehydrogenase [Spirochaetia bacterium]|nr:NAD-dependent succinate-semialdehyde dehydrogenase [Spirochaetia bacterium]